MAYPRPSVALLSGIGVTAAAAALFQAAPVAITFESLQGALDTRLGIWLWENPLPILPFLGGIPGALTAGYLTRGPWYDALVDGIRGVLAGTVLAYAIIVTYNLGVLYLLGLFTPSAPLIVGFRQLFSFLIPLGLVFVFESIPASLLGYGIARGVDRGIARDAASVDAATHEVTALAGLACR